MNVISVYEFYQIRGSNWFTAPDVNVTLGPGLTETQNAWIFNVVSQWGADLIIELGPETWGLHPTEISHYNIQFGGHTYTHNNAQILLVISVGDRYFAQMKSLDTSKEYGECPSSNSPLMERNVSKMMHSETPDRYNRFCDNNQWHDHEHDKSTIWPMGFFLYSNPFDNTLNYSWYHDFTKDESIDVSSYYTSTFPANQGLKIYISGTKIGQSFDIERINLFYQTHQTETKPIVETETKPIVVTESKPIVIHTSRKNILIYGTVFVCLAIIWISHSTMKFGRRKWCNFAMSTDKYRIIRFPKLMSKN